MKIVDTPIDRLKANPRNPRRISQARLEQLMKALEHDPEMLRARPLIALPDGTVIAGNQRLRAARELGWKKIPTVTVDLDERRQHEWTLRDNAGYGEDDDELVAELLRELAGMGGDVDLTGYASAQVEALLRATAPKPVVDPDAVPAVPAVPRSRPGEVYELGPHRLMCGDSLDALATFYAGVKVGCVLTDPPYGINLDTDFNQPHGRVSGRTYRPVIGDDKPFDAAPYVSAFASVREQFWFGANYYRRTLSDSDLDGSWLVWDKRTEATDVVAGSCFELAWSRTPHKQDVLRHMWTNYTSQFNAGLQREHPTEKPVKLLAEILDRWAPKGCVVADPFAGSGTTLIACEMTGRRCYAVELDPGYCDVIRNRYAAFTATA